MSPPYRSISLTAYFFVFPNLTFTLFCFLYSSVYIPLVPSFLYSSPLPFTIYSFIYLTFFAITSLSFFPLSYILPSLYFSLLPFLYFTSVPFTFMQLSILFLPFFFLFPPLVFPLFIFSCPLCFPYLPLLPYPLILFFPFLVPFPSLPFPSLSSLPFFCHRFYELPFPSSCWICNSLPPLTISLLLNLGHQFFHLPLPALLCLILPFPAVSLPFSTSFFSTPHTTPSLPFIQSQVDYSLHNLIRNQSPACALCPIGTKEACDVFVPQGESCLL